MDLKQVKEIRKRIKLKVMDHMNWTSDYAEIWMQTDNLNFGGTSPSFLISCGCYKKLEKFVDNSIKELL